MSTDDRGSLPFWSIPLGNLGGLRVRASTLLLLLPIVFCAWYGIAYGLAAAVTVLTAAVLHETGRVLAALAQRSELKSIVLWPAGGLTAVERHSGFPPVSMHLGGIAANALVCAAIAWPLWINHALGRAFDLTQFGDRTGSESAGVDALVLIFAVNWALVLINLLPLVPFDGGWMFEAALTRWIGDSSAEVVVRRVGWVIATLLLTAGLAFQSLLVVAAAGLGMVSLLTRHVREPEFEAETERFLGYDFSEGYTSLDRSTPQEETPPPPGLFERWRIRREQLRRVREARFDREVNDKLDEILAKVHASGMSSLTHHEQQLLQRASTRYRERGTSLSE